MSKEIKQTTSYKATENQGKIVWFLEKVFIVLFFLYAVSGSNSITYGRTIITYIMWPALILGGVLFFYRLIHFKSYSKMTGLVSMIAMLGSIGLSTIINHNYSFKDNLIFCVYWVLFFTVLYTIENDKTIDQIRKDFHFVALMFLVYMSVGVIISIIQMIKGYKGTFFIPEDYYAFHSGFAIGRLWGIFINPNNGAISSAIAIILLVYFIRKIKNKIFWILPILDICLFLFYVALSDSRSGAVCTGVAVGCYVLSTLLYKGMDKKGKKRLAHNLITLFVALAVVVAGIAIPRQVKNLYNVVAVAVAEYKEQKLNEQKKDDPDAPVENIVVTPVVIDRGYDITVDITNRRADAWRSALEISRSSNKVFLIGTSFKGFTEYALEYVPYTYIVNNDYAYFTTFDNEIFNVLVSQGIIGLIILAWLVLTMFVNLFMNYFKVQKENQELLTILGSVAFGLAAAAMFCSVMFYHFSQNTILFWVALGCMMFVLKKSKDIYKSKKLSNDSVVDGE